MVGHTGGALSKDAFDTLVNLLLSFLQLPGEILDEILSEIDSHDHLASFTLASKACARLASPRHTQYRIIRVRHSMPDMWAHLARRKDLARNIREVHICDRRNYSAPDIYPTKLVEEVDLAPQNAEESIRVMNLTDALRSMSMLHTFTWASSQDRIRPATHRSYEALILAAVRNKTSLKHVGLDGRFGIYADSVNIDTKSIGYPAWTYSNLTSLYLYGDGWIKPSNIAHVRRMLERSPHLEHLELPLEFRSFEECRFPRLKRLKLFLQSGATSAIDQSRAEFLHNHPTLEELYWFPIGMVSFSSECLPSLKVLKSSRQVLESIESQTVRRPLECLDVMSVDAEMLIRLQSLDRDALKKLRLHNLGDIEDMQHLAQLFPSITWLSLPSHHLPPGGILPLPISRTTWLALLPKFRNLEIFRGQGIWDSVKRRKEYMHLVIQQLALICPNLRELDHCDFYERRHAYKRIVIIRETEKRGR
ncbi:hypothetical protein BDQ17DRAFT_1392538 [Cyathus striatus]|nr:hypothetical protein BDQ17DRAFT_1392538 [Cyathus striatus]